MADRLFFSSRDAECLGQPAGETSVHAQHGEPGRFWVEAYLKEVRDLQLSRPDGSP
jgi:hypothetical protein